MNPAKKERERKWRGKRRRRKITTTTLIQYFLTECAMCCNVAIMSQQLNLVYRHVQSHIRWNNRSHNWAKLSGNIDLTGTFEHYDDYDEDDNDDHDDCMRNIHKLVLYSVHTASNISISQSSISTNTHLNVNHGDRLWYLTRFIGIKFIAFMIQWMLYIFETRMD